MKWNELELEIDGYYQKLKESLEELGIYEACNNLDIDHVCVRLRDPANVDHLKEELSEVGKLISSVQVNGREINIFQLKNPLKLGQWETLGVELPYPKPNHSYLDGWEHVEFVLKEAKNTMQGVREVFFKTFKNLDVEELKTKYSYSENEPHAEGDQLPNPTIGLEVKGVGVKFHANSIQTIVGFK